MPFTFSHPAIVLPLLNKRYKLFSATGLIIGSIIPDFESFIRLNIHKLYSHTWLGMFWFDLPLGIIVAFLFHNVVRDATINNLPGFLEKKVKRFEGFNWNSFFGKHYLKVICSMLIGIVLHLLWDAFTHLNLANPDAIDSDIYIGQYQLFKVLQDTNSIFGLLLMAWYILVAPAPKVKQEPTVATEKMIFMIAHTPRKRSKLIYWIVAAIVDAISVLMLSELLTQRMTFVLFIDINITGAMLGLIVASVAWMLQSRADE